ncbi:predicted protein [Histoplasma capsulatum G186AR]|uniref:Uncharacterized protein n=1 Tax=Ajellomyces capsulatus (strain G186AR / H82 / ATCC MYA-2454 / RMSCC 2432) TaxID=447093 RepID=C0NY26_AJECG|nr:uncharacterized protein HCBG_07820 [Histoplasma capsulatum G186AR]EEH03694.1 predicted protein [Histoplasma capsulatum G186AR]
MQFDRKCVDRTMAINSVYLFQIMKGISSQSAVKKLEAIGTLGYICYGLMDTTSVYSVKRCTAQSQMVCAACHLQLPPKPANAIKLSPEDPGTSATKRKSTM